LDKHIINYISELKCYIIRFAEINRVNPQENYAKRLDKEKLRIFSCLTSSNLLELFRVLCVYNNCKYVICMYHTGMNLA
jgi:hypothetical protein